ncbi:MAG: cob(I)yrinic acid a,c-diamide adenosyltransferase [Ruminococcus sp.]|nr:cob(I)yrinic acid a,c-diamide adenosyltransferase [Ruminococcus sp.]
MIHIYHGNGKGKTTAVTGLAVRAVGADMRVLFMQFLKNGSSSEIKILEKIKNIDVYCCDECNKFTYAMNDEERQKVTARHNEMLGYAVSSQYDMIILDEFLDAYNKNMLDREKAEKLVLESSAEIVLTGRNPSEIFLANAEYISEIKSVKHPYEKGISARKGIEY